MKREYIKEGTEIQTALGFIEVLGYNGSGLFDCLIFEEDEEGEEKGERRYLTKSDIAGMMKEIDGRNHEVVWDGNEEGEEADV